MKFGFDHVHLIGSDLDLSERFYRDMFGAETVGRLALANGALNLLMRLDGINLFIRSPRPSETVQADGAEIRYTYDHFGVVVEDLSSAVEELRGKGVNARAILDLRCHLLSGRSLDFVARPPANLSQTRLHSASGLQVC
jgi:catechol 2,3-dioxygenase-like lactoylglutathione lyase family enzyme